MMKSLLRYLAGVGAASSGLGDKRSAEADSRLGRMLQRHRGEKPKPALSSPPQPRAEHEPEIRPLYDASVYVSPMLLDEEVPDVPIYGF
jgi:hypothetical protein